MRWSSEPQTWGDSERRQEALAREWCQRHGRTLAEQSFVDKGVSGREGKNREKGALGDLLKLANEGDTVLIEDCDRWSREKVDTVLVNLRKTGPETCSSVFHFGPALRMDGKCIGLRCDS